MRGKWLITALALSTTVTLWAAPVNAGELYRWTDKNGNPVISDRPPPSGTPYTTLNGAKYGISPSSSIKAPKPVPTPRAPQNSNEPSAKASPPPKVELKKNPELCKQAKEEIFNLETFARIRVEGEDGEIHYITDEERAARLETAREIEASACPN